MLKIVQMIVIYNYKKMAEKYVFTSSPIKNRLLSNLFFVFIYTYYTFSQSQWLSFRYGQDILWCRRVGRIVSPLWL